MNIGEGAAMLVLEDFDAARRRGATIYAEVAGHSLTCEAFHPTSPEPDGRAIADAIRRALSTGRRCRTRSITSTRMAPRRRRTTAQRRVASARCSASGRRRLPVTSIKSMMAIAWARRGRRSRDRGAHHRPRGDSADDPPRRHRSGMRRRHRRQRGAGNAGAVRGLHVARLRRQRLRPGAPSGVESGVRLNGGSSQSGWS